MRRVIDSKTRGQSLVAEPEQSAKSEFLVVTRTRAARCHFRHTRGALKMSIWSKKETVCRALALITVRNVRFRVIGCNSKWPTFECKY